MTTRPPPIQHDPTLVRPAICGPDSGPASPPFPVRLEGWVSRGFGRGSKDLGCPTANLPDSAISPYFDTLETGVYFGFARVLEPASSPRSSTDEHDRVHPMVMSIGWNPFYNNDTRTAEVHILHEYPSDFYGKELRVVMLGFIRPEYNYTSMDALIKDIETDKKVALESVTTRASYRKFEYDEFFFHESTLDPPTEDLSKPRVKPDDSAH
ncbi:riboflavin kinase [Sporobolomyces koalae]|uniref:riboflavin kinase n=1 Tax=Sporobolomyces koalae TaxID=500713 RepID=UPI00317A308F